MIDKDFAILVGDANGADRAVQQYLGEKGYRNVIVHCMTNNCRNNVGGWPTREVLPPKGARGFAYYAAKDQAMVDDVACTSQRQRSFLTVSGMMLLTVVYAGCGGPPSSDPGRPLHLDRADVDCSAGEDRIPSYSKMVEVSGLMQCIRYGHVEEALALIAQGAELERRTDLGDHALSWAVEAGAPTIVRALLDRGVSLHPGRGGMPLLGVAIDRRDRVLVEMLLEAGADSTAHDIDGSPLISNAARTGDTVIARLLLDRGADVNADPRDEFSGGPPLVEAGSAAMIEFLLDRGANINLPEWYHNESLLWRLACRPQGFETGTDRVALARFLIEKGAEVEARDAGFFTGRLDEGQTPLICAVTSGDVGMAEMLLTHGARADVVHRGQSLLEIARKQETKGLIALVERALR